MMGGASGERPGLLRYAGGAAVRLLTAVRSS